MQVAVTGYETRVKIFLILVVLFLATANFVTVTFLIRSEERLVEEATARLAAAATSVAGQIGRDGSLAGILEGRPGARSEMAADLYRYARVHGAALLEIIDAEGRVVASSQPWRVGIVEPIAPLQETGTAAELLSGRTVVGAPDGPLTLAWAPVGGDGGRGGHYLRAGFVMEAARAVAGQIRLLTWVQGIGGSLVLAMVLLFTRWVLRPYRELRAAAEGIPPPPEAARSAADDPGFLVASFKGVVEKMRFLEAELEKMRGGVSWPGGQEPLLASLSSGVLLVGESGEVAALNPAGEAILGVRAADLVGLPVGEALGDSPELLAILLESLRHGRGRSRQVVSHRLPGGRSVHLGVTVSGSPGRAGGALCLFSDLTEIRSVQDRVALKENLARLGHLSAGIAHEFRNSLGTILGYARLAGRGEGEGADHARAIIREVKAMERLVNEFLRYAGPARLQKGPCDLRDLVEEIAAEMGREGESAVRITVEGTWPPALEADETLVRQAFHNLVRNAAEAARSGEPPATVRVEGRLEGDSVTVEIRDSGPGFPEEILDRIFTPFVTTKARGTGLGMALAQKVIVSHDGAIEAENPPGGGGLVRVLLPRA